MKRKPSDKLRDMETPMVLGCVELDRTTLTPVRRPIPAAPKPVEPSLGPMMVVDLPPDPAPESGLLRDLMALSSGTIAGLATKAGIDGTPDEIQERLILFYLRHYHQLSKPHYMSKRWSTWMDVWKHFHAVDRIAKMTPEQRDAIVKWLDEKKENE